jgi:CheY-like chemotaxis protein
MKDPRHHFLILVVDDSPDTARSTAELLTLMGYTVRVAFSGHAALRLAAAESPDVVLLDLRMPGMDGCEVARRLTADGAGKPPVIVAVTGCGTEEDRVRTAAAGFDLHLVKPVDPGVLVGLLRRLRRAITPPEPPEPPPFPCAVSPDPGSPACGRNHFACS